MKKGREAGCLLAAVLVAASSTTAQTGLMLSVAPNSPESYSQTSKTLSVPADSPSWDLEGQVERLRNNATCRRRNSRKSHGEGLVTR